MATVWIVTTGNSDARLLTNKDFLVLKDTSAKRDLLGSCYTKFKPIKNDKDDWSLSGRVMGIVYGDAISEHRSKLEFPLLEGFCTKLKEEEKEPDRIIILLTDQEAIFEDRNDPDSPYWKDTCTLQPIFEKYFKEKYDASVEPVLLQPEDKTGLDDWNATLRLVQAKFAELGINKDDDVIVSHQAGTPAISSAVQFASLSRFGDKVSFLTSNERTKVASLNPSSSYFESMQIQEARKFLKNFDYVSTASVLKGKLERLKEQNPDQADKIIKLLEVAKLWNLSKFDEFETAMRDLPVQNLQDIAVSRFDDSWNWWIAYEEAYLGIIRRNQENIVEAFFHSFRAFEGIFAEWGKNTFDGYLDSRKGKSAILKPSVLEYLEPYFNQHFSLSAKKQSNDIKNLKTDIENSQPATDSSNDETKVKQEIREVELNFATLCKLYKLIRSEYRSKFKELGLVLDTDGISSQRNLIFHQVEGIQESKLIKIWSQKNVDISQDEDHPNATEHQIQDWEDKILRFLNFIADEKDFKTWEEASLMARVHKELEAEIGRLQ
ncbi:MAG: hypothetical protein WCO45_10340 [Pseudanabaena sp. ELA607]